MITLETRVTAALVACPPTRDSDDLLYVKICKGINPDVVNMKFEEVMLRKNEFGLPPYESVSRARRRVQEKFPELAGSEKVTDMRYERFKEMLDYVSE